jgi:hypothetical protein
MKKLFIAILILATCAAHAQNPLTSQEYSIDTAITNKTASKSITPAAVGTQMKDICNAIYTYFMKYTDSARLISAGSIGATQIKANAPSSGQVLGWNGSNLAWANMMSGNSYKISSHTYYLSTMGFYSDCDLSFYPSMYGSDQTLHLQQILDSAKYYNDVIIVVDIAASCTGLLINKNTHLIIPAGDGLVLRPSSNKPLIRNADTAFGHCIDSNIIIEGTGVLNGNGFSITGYRNNNFTNGSYGISAPIAMYGVYNLRITDLNLINSAGYALAANTVVRAWYERIYIENSLASPVNTDGLHMDGNSSDGWINNCIIKNCKDDAIAFNADDIYYTGSGSTSGNFYPISANGPIKRMHVQNCVLENGTYGVRIMSMVSRVDQIWVDNLSGYTTNYEILIDNYASGTRGNFGSINITNPNVKLFGKTNDANADIKITCDVELLSIHGDMLGDIVDTSTSSIQRMPTIKIGGGTNSKIRIQKFILDGAYMYDTSALAPKLLVLQDSVNIKTMILNNISAIRTNDSMSKHNYSVFNMGNADTIFSMMVTNFTAWGYGFAIVNSGGASYIQSMNIAGANIKRCPGLPYGFINNNGRIEHLNMSAVEMDSVANLIYNTGTIGDETGDAFAKYQYATIANPIFSGNITTTRNVVTGGICGSSKYIGGTYTACDSDYAMLVLGGTLTLPTTGLTPGHEFIIEGYISPVLISPLGFTIPPNYALHVRFDVPTASYRVLSYGPTTTLPFYVSNAGTDAIPKINGDLIIQGMSPSPVYLLNPSSVILGSTNHLIFVDGNGTVTLPTTGVQPGQTYQFIHYGANAGSITISGITPVNVLIGPNQSLSVAFYNGLWKASNSSSLTYTKTVNAISTTGAVQTIPHGLLGISSLSTLILTPNNIYSSAFLYATVDMNNIYITYNSPMTSGNNLIFSFLIKP